jgi:hypothetical protein
VELEDSAPWEKKSQSSGGGGGGGGSGAQDEEDEAAVERLRLKKQRKRQAYKQKKKQGIVGLVGGVGAAAAELDTGQEEITPNGEENFVDESFSQKKCGESPLSGNDGLELSTEKKSESAGIVDSFRVRDVLPSSHRAEQAAAGHGGADSQLHSHFLKGDLELRALEPNTVLPCIDEEFSTSTLEMQSSPPAEAANLQMQNTQEGKSEVPDSATLNESPSSSSSSSSSDGKAKKKKKKKVSVIPDETATSSHLSNFQLLQEEEKQQPKQESRQEAAARVETELCAAVNTFLLCSERPGNIEAIIAQRTVDEYPDLIGNDDDAEDNEGEVESSDEEEAGDDINETKQGDFGTSNQGAGREGVPVEASVTDSDARASAGSGGGGGENNGEKTKKKSAINKEESLMQIQTEAGKELADALWEVELTDPVIKWMTKTRRKNPGLVKNAMRVLLTLATGYWNERNHKPLKGPKV